MGPSSHNPEVRFVSGNSERVFRNPERIVRADNLEDVLPALETIEAGVAAGLTAAGFLSYEAGPAFDSALSAHPSRDFPLLWFGLFKDSAEEVPEAPTGECRVGPWRPLVDRATYDDALTRIHDFIGAGDTYQVNYTFPLEADFEGDAVSLWRQLCRAQVTPYGTYIDAGNFRVLSASPELFFRLDGERLQSRPMKGTRARALTQEEDARVLRDLSMSEKDRAENVMIVDMVRNDLGRIARGTVSTPQLFAVERYPTVWQMTSTVAAETDASVPEIFGALFPCASVTGAPKYRTTEIIRELEPEPRGVYCGAIGWWAPDRQACFSVGIRTARQDVACGTLRYHTGSGVTWDSSATAEYEECLDKAAVLHFPAPDFQLLETLLFDGGYYLLREHMDRLAASAAYFGFRCRREWVTQQLARRAAAFGGRPHRVRLLLDEEGNLTLEPTPYEAEDRTFSVRLAQSPVDRNDVFLYHKTTHREVYAQARAGLDACDDVILYNGEGELTESTIGNIVVALPGGKHVTPPVASGLLNGTFRRHLLAAGEIEEGVLFREDLARAAGVWIINSVRQWVPAKVLA
jgi:para-aminobenzoate synthetase/4-amino-4-deoxychorismate lyase